VRKSAGSREPPEYGRGTGVPDPIDVFVGAQIRTRRLLLDINQGVLAQALGLTFQQVQKYESGANRVSASRLWEIAAILRMPISYFFPSDQGENEPNEHLQRPESIELIRSYYAIPDARIRRQLFDMVKTVSASPDRATR
jgi:transcriptional regulator with XRE-family HTH domain